MQSFTDSPKGSRKPRRQDSDSPTAARDPVPNRSVAVSRLRDLIGRCRAEGTATEDVLQFSSEGECLAPSPSENAPGPASWAVDSSFSPQFAANLQCSAAEMDFFFGDPFD